MLRINQFAKDHGVSNTDVIEVLEKRLGIAGKSHSSNLTDDQAALLQGVFESKPKGTEEPAPSPRPSAPVRVVKAHPAAPAAVSAPAPPPVHAPAVLVKKAPVQESAATQAEPVKVEQAAPATPSAVSPAPVPAIQPPADQSQSFSRLRVSQAPAPTPKPSEPARYIQLPQAPVPRPKAEPGAKAVIQRPGQPGQPGQAPSGQVRRSGMPQPEKTVLPMATNTGKGEIKHEPTPNPAVRRFSSLPSISQLQPEGGFTKITMSDTPAPAPRVQQPARYIQLPQPRPVGGGPSRPSGPGGPSRPSGPGGPNRPSGPGGSRPSGPGARPGGGPGARPSGPYRPSGPGGRPSGGPGRSPVIPNTGPIDPNAQKGPGRGASAHGKKKKGYTKEQQEMDLKLRQPRSRAQQIATEYIDDEIGIVMLSEGVTVKELAEKCNRAAKDVMAKLLHRGMFVTINQPLDTD
ncbi:MAG: translation initiation factor IF-2 N-terminal domain-containing protein, partial [Holophaga sp.]|nr:translation initiation factor IF-2 N-terminal domain-containing protein [Holophaga sp.]